MNNFSIYISIAAALVAAGCARNTERHAHRETAYPGYTVVAPQAGSLAGPASPHDSAARSQESRTNVQNTATFYSSDIFSTDMADNRVVSQIRQAVNADDSLDAVAPAIQIGASQGTVALFGRVNTVQEKRRVEELARGASGVAAVNNQIEVSSIASTGSAGALTATSRGDGDTVRDVNTRAGVSDSAMQSGDALSKGTTNLLSATSRDGSPVRHLEGVSNRVDSLQEQLEPTSREGSSGGVSVQVQGANALDRSLADQISQELKSDTSLASAVSNVSIAINEGRVTLTGSVKNEVQKREIESMIQRVTGVSSVDNQLRVISPGSDSLPHNP